MTPTVAAAAYAIIGFSGPFGLMLRVASLPFLARSLAVWLLTALILFVVDDQLTVLGLAGLIIVALAPSDPVQRVCFFFVAAPCLPAYLQVFLPFPGINWLVMLTHYKVVVFFVLAPLLFRSPPPGSGRGTFSMADACVVIYIAFSVILVTASMGFTAGPRFLIDQLLVLGIPYFVLSRTIRTQEDLDLCFRAILVVSLILACIAIVATLKQWDFYRLKEPPSASSIPDYRSGFIRIAATANTHSLGYHLAIGILLLEHLKRSLGLGFVRLWLFRALMLAGLLSTDSRGSMMGLAVAFILYAVIMVRKSGLRWAMLIALVLAIGGAGFWLFTTEDASSVDAYNSVGYRQLLFQVSIDHILEHPIWGDLDFIKDPKFRVLLQGQGIIDITSLYLQIGLSFGLLGLAPFFGGFAMTMWGLLRRVVRLAADVSEDRAPTRRMGAILLSALVGWFLLIATTSDVALTLHLGVILIALARAITRFERFKPASVRVEKPPSLRELAYRILSPGERAGEAR